MWDTQWLQSNQGVVIWIFYEFMKQEETGLQHSAHKLREDTLLQSRYSVSIQFFIFFISMI
jgi:hypothetical protein